MNKIFKYYYINYKINNIKIIYFATICILYFSCNAIKNFIQSKNYYFFGCIRGTDFLMVNATKDAINTFKKPLTKKPNELIKTISKGT